MTNLETIAGYTFTNSELLQQALTHPSMQGEANYERMEFLGDAILSAVISAYLYDVFPNEKEGDLAKRRSALVCGDTLAKVARTIDLGKMLVLSEGEGQAGGRDHGANLENTFEAVVGAIYLDGGFKAADEWLRALFIDLAQEMITPPKDPKTMLQEMAQSEGKQIPQYEVVKQEGLAHAPQFTIVVKVEGWPEASAIGNSKREAERKSAEILLERLGDAGK